MWREGTFVELRTYWRILRRRWPFVLLPALIVMVIGLLTLERPPASYTVTLHYLVSQEPSVSATTDEEARQFTWVTSQYVVNSITDWVNRTDFATRIAERLQAAGTDIDVGSLIGNIEAETTRSRLELTLTYPDRDLLEAIAAAATVVLREDNLQALPHLGSVPAQIEPIDRIYIAEIGPGLLTLFDLPLRVFVALGTGIGLALLIEYVDPKIRTRTQVEAINLRLIGEIPRD